MQVSNCPEYNTSMRYIGIGAIGLCPCCYNLYYPIMFPHIYMYIYINTKYINIYIHIKIFKIL